jgi:hypothetical protein
MPRTSDPNREAFWRKLIAQQTSSQLSVAKLCEHSRVSPASFYTWRQRLYSLDGAAKRSSLVPVRVVADQQVGCGEITVELADDPAQSLTIRVCIPVGCDELSIRRVLCAVLSARAGGGPSC